MLNVQDIAAFWQRPRGAFFVALQDGADVAGCVAVKAGPDCNAWLPGDDSHDACQLSRLSVGSEHRRKGVGEALCAAVEAWALQKGLSKARSGLVWP